MSSLLFRNKTNILISSLLSANPFCRHVNQFHLIKGNFIVKTNYKFLRGPLFFAAIALSASANAADCGKVTISDMNWASAEFAAYLDQFILNNGYDCDAELVPGDTVPTTTSMIEKNEPDIAPELWVNSARAAIDQAVTDGKLAITVNILKDGGEEGWWVPRYTAEAHNLKTVADVLAHPELFPAPEDSSKGAFVTCPSGWGCEINNGNLFRAFELEKAGFVKVDPGSAAGLDGSIAKAFEREENWFGYYWAPTSILGKYDMVKLDFDADYDPDNWNNCIVKEGCENPQKTSWTVSDVRTAVTQQFIDRVPAEVVDYLSKRSYHNPVLNNLLAWMTDEQATGEDGALYFLKNHEDLWSQWVTEAAAAKIKSSL
ncbi:MAG: ABC transporter substrate-binding protein [Gammaproteobacteria bacterium]|nr:ABC transporter substrate-binding protein [Gammaproteobacteria bacterium]